MCKYINKNTPRITTKSISLTLNSMKNQCKRAFIPAIGQSFNTSKANPLLLIQKLSLSLVFLSSIFLLLSLRIAFIVSLSEARASCVVVEIRVGYDR